MKKQRRLFFHLHPFPVHTNFRNLHEGAIFLQIGKEKGSVSLAFLRRDGVGAFDGEDAIFETRDARMQGEMRQLFPEPQRRTMDDECGLRMFRNTTLLENPGQNAEDVIHGEKNSAIAEGCKETLERTGCLFTRYWFFVFC